MKSLQEMMFRKRLLHKNQKRIHCDLTTIMGITVVMVTVITMTNPTIAGRIIKASASVTVTQSNIIPTSHFQIQHIIVGNNGKTKIMLRTFVIHAVKPLRQSKGDHFVFVVFTIKDSFFLIISGTNLVHI